MNVRALLAWPLLSFSALSRGALEIFARRTFGNFRGARGGNGAWWTVPRADQALHDGVQSESMRRPGGFLAARVGGTDGGSGSAVRRWARRLRPLARIGSSQSGERVQLSSNRGSHREVEGTGELLCQNVSTTKRRRWLPPGLRISARPRKKLRKRIAELTEADAFAEAGEAAAAVSPVDYRRRYRRPGRLCASGVHVEL